MSDDNGPVAGSTRESPDSEDNSIFRADSGSSSSTATSEQGGGRGIFRSHKAVTALAAIFILLAGAAGGFAWWLLYHQIDGIDRVPVGITTVPDKEGSNGEKGQPLNILLLGADHGDAGQSVAEDLADGNWTPFEHRSDTIMLVHISADRETVQLLSIPRDTWTKIDGYPSPNHYAKINGAFSLGGPALAVKTVEELTGIGIDHLAIIDWVGFRDLTTALGGVRVYIPETFYDESQRVTWEKGWQTLEGELALQYVRTRYGLSKGDFDRIARQQNFLRSTMAQLLSRGTTRNPITLTKVVNVITGNLTVDDSWDSDEIRSLAFDLKNLTTDDVQFVTAPFGRYDTSPDGQSIVRLAPERSEALFEAVRKDDISTYLDKYPKAQLGSKTSVN